VKKKKKNKEKDKSKKSKKRHRSSPESDKVNGNLMKSAILPITESNANTVHNGSFSMMQPSLCAGSKKGKEEGSKGMTKIFSASTLLTGYGSSERH
jgi:hypothetical protein